MARIRNDTFPSEVVRLVTAVRPAPETRTAADATGAFVARFRTVSVTVR